MTVDSKTNILVIGGGKMGGGMIRAWINAGVLDPAQITVSDPDQSVRTDLAALGASAVADPGSAPPADIVVVAVKPQILDAVLAPHHAVLSDRLVISIAAGVKLSALRQICESATWVRVMPNQPGIVGQGASGIYADDPDARTVARVDALMKPIGDSIWVDREELMHAVTGLSGSGPAFVAVFIEALEDAGVRAGLPRVSARRLALQTVKGSAEQISSLEWDPSDLKDAVTSPGGTTIAGIRALEKAGLRSAVMDAVDAAVRRSIELGGD